MNNYPSLRIYGNPKAHGGSEEIYILNGGADVFIPKNQVGMGEVSHYYTVKITGYNIQYVLVSNEEMRSFGSPPRTAELKMGIAIPKHYRLKGGVSPHDVLMDVYKTMMDKNLSTISGTSTLQYNERMCDVSVFETLLQKYPLEEYKSAYRPMNGPSAALLVTDKISEFMKDPHYPELQEYSEVIVATAGAYPVRVPDLPIPRVPQFSLYVNGELRRKSLNANSPIEPIRWGGYDERCFYLPSPIEISMSAIINNHSFPQEVNVDWENERINCTLSKPSPRTEIWQVKIEDVHNAQTIFNRIQVYLTTKNEKKLVNVNLSGLFSLSGEDIIAHKDILYNGSDYEISSQCEKANLKQISVTMKKKAVTPSHEPTPTNNPQKIAIILPPEAIAESGKDHSGKIKWYPKGRGDKTVYYCEEVVFNVKENEEEEEVELWFSEVMLPPCLQANNGQLYISVKTKKAIYDGYGQIASKSQHRIGCNTDKFMDLGDEEKWTFFSFWKRRIKLIFYLFALLLAFAVGIALGVRAERNWSTDHGPGDPPVVENPDSIRAAELIEQYECLNNDSVTFDEIEWLNTAIKNVNDEVLEYLPDKEGMLRRADAYYRVVEKLRNADVCDDQFEREFIGLLDSTRVYSNGDLATNLRYCRYLYKEDNYAGDKKKLKQAQDIFLKKTRKGEINRFTDLESIKEEVERATPPTPSAPPPGNGTNNNGQPSATATQQGGVEDGPDGEH